jgi:ubiquinone/menaquinone biosynthesis C-methylase UbiE
MTDAVGDALRSNYSVTGVAVMQAMYSTDYLSMGGVASTDELAERAGVSHESHVLDVGCGVGGPMLHLADRYGCTVTGLDLVESSIAEADRRAAARDLAGRARFVAGDATDLPFESGDFDIVWGQDAWCHIPDKAQLVAECARVTAPGGVMAFIDWLAGDGMSTADRDRVLSAALSTRAATADEYRGLLADNGFENVEFDDLSSVFTQQYCSIFERLTDRRAALVEQFGERVYGIVRDMNETILEGFEQGGIRGGRFVARRR